MRRFSTSFCLALICGLMIITSAAVAQKHEEMRFVQADSLMIVGKAFEQSIVKYGRLPKVLEGEFRKELETLINRYSKENGSDTPDFILADFLIRVLEAFDHTVRDRGQWYGQKTPFGRY